MSKLKMNQSGEKGKRHSDDIESKIVSDADR